MSSDDLLRRLSEARPEDPAAQTCGPAAVRILARLAVLEAGRRSVEADPRPVPRLRDARGAASRGGRVRWIAAAALLLVLLPGRMQSRSTNPRSGAERPMPIAAGPVVDPWTDLVTAALAGDVRKRARILRGGAPARAALLRAGRVGGVRGREALELLRTAGSLRGPAEAAAITALVEDPELRDAALGLLAMQRGPDGAASLGDVLERVADAEAGAVAALIVVADRGRRDAALGALLRGAAKGRKLAAAQAFAIASADAVGRVVQALPEAVREAPEVLRAVRTAPPTLRARLVRLAEGGDEEALDLAVHARIPGVLPLLAARALDAPTKQAAAAVEALAEYGGMEAWLAIARALGGAADGRARLHLAQAPASAIDALAQRAASAPRDAGAAMAGLAAAGDAGVTRLTDLARQTRLGPTAVRALAVAAGRGADRALGALAERPALAPSVIAALGVRLARGRTEAGEILLDLARSRHDRAVFRALESAGPAGRGWLERAGAEPALERRARASLARVDAQARHASKELARSRRRQAKRPRGEARSI